jgi:hypothetical protein
MPNDPIQICFSVPSGGSGDGTVKVTVNDTDAGFLSDKLTAGTGITLTVINPGGDEQLVISATGATSDVNMFLEELVFDYNSVFPLLVQNVHAGYFVHEVRLQVTTAFNGTVTLNVGSPGIVDRLMAATENDPTDVGAFSSWPQFEYAGDDIINLYGSVAGATQGAGLLTVVSRTV